MGRLRPVKKFFLDTYAIQKYLRGNAEYLNRMSGAELATSLLNLMELYYVFLRDHGEKAAESVYSTYRHYQAEIIDEDVRSGMALKLRMKSKRVGLSYADALGYAIAERLRMKYLTGDDAFRSLPNVEFVK